VTRLKYDRDLEHRNGDGKTKECREKEHQESSGRGAKEADNCALAQISAKGARKSSVGGTA